MQRHLTAAKGLMLFWGAIAATGGAGAVAIQAMGPPAALDQKAAPARAPAIDAEAAPTKPSTVPLPPAARTPPGPRRQLASAALPPLRVSVPSFAPAKLPKPVRGETVRSHRVALATPRKLEQRALRQVAAPEEAATEPYWTFAQAQYAAAQYPVGWGAPRISRYPYGATSYYGAYRGY